VRLFVKRAVIRHAIPHRVLVPAHTPLLQDDADCAVLWLISEGRVHCHTRPTYFANNGISVLRTNLSQILEHRDDVCWHYSRQDPTVCLLLQILLLPFLFSAYLLVLTTTFFNMSIFVSSLFVCLLWPLIIWHLFSAFSFKFLLFSSFLVSFLRLVLLIHLDGDCVFEISVMVSIVYSVAFFMFPSLIASHLLFVLS